MTLLFFIAQNKYLNISYPNQQLFAERYNIVSKLYIQKIVNTNTYLSY